jgi:uncharacterized membrane protein (UPF0127 family)
MFSPVECYEGPTVADDENMTTSWFMRPRTLLGVLIAVLVVLYLVGLSNKKRHTASKSVSAAKPSGDGAAVPPAAERLAKLPVVSVTIAGKHFQLWLATTPAEKASGLMFVKHLAADQGMIFLFHHTAPKTFWMKNTPLPLDAIFLNGSKIVRMYTMKPMNSKRLYPSVQPVTAAIELNGGTCAKLGLKPGDHIVLPVSAN